MIIGIDFDNTIACYDDLFPKIAIKKKVIPIDSFFDNKLKVKNYLVKLENKKTEWMKLQGLVYGKYMAHAILMPGVINFLISCKMRGYKICIVSHKTKYGHFDKDKISLRTKAIEWMETNLFFDKTYCGIRKKNVFFANTRKEKVNIISQLKCDWFIDDLPEIFKEPNFPKNTNKILYGKNPTVLKGKYSSFSSWREIIKKIIIDFSENDMLFWANKITDKSLIKINIIEGKGNSLIYKVQCKGGFNYVLKHYPQDKSDKRPRLKTEYDSLSLLKKNNFLNIPKPVSKDLNLNLGLFEWIKGENIINPSIEDLNQLIKFVKDLNRLSKKVKNKSKINNASEDCISLKSLFSQISNRINRLKSEGAESQELLNFLKNTLEPVWIELKSQKKIIKMKVREKVPKSLQILSPSDFGFHNSIKGKKDEIFFIDFEYFGWDDPVKLTADFLWHPAMNLNSKIKSKWENSMMKIFSIDPNFKERFRYLMPFYGLRWALIILNEFLPQIAKKRKEASQKNSFNKKKVKEEQILKSREYCLLVKRMKDKYIHNG